MSIYKSLTIIVFCILFNFANTLLLSKSVTFFSPKDKISEKLLRFIDNSQNKIYAAVYMLTDKTIVDALIKAKNDRNVDVQIVTDQASLESKYGKINFLKENGIDVFVFKSDLRGKKQNSKIMHNKFAIFDNKIWTGSFNWTVKANNKNFENVLCSDDEELYKRYNSQFDQLKQYCIKDALDQYTKKKESNSKKVMAKSKKAYNGLKNNLVGFFKNIKNKLKSKKKENKA